MTQLTFKKAARAQKKARVAIYGASGSGKTYTALTIASGMCNRIAVIDTERGSASLYSDRFAFDVLELENFHPDAYIAAIEAAQSAGYEVVIIDSLTHAWLDILNRVDAVGSSGSSSFSSGWGKIGTPLYQKLMSAILDCKIHVIACMRSKTEYAVEETTNAAGKRTTAPKKLGMAPVMRADSEYEFDLVLTMDEANNATVSKTRMGDVIAQRTNRPDRTTGQKIMAWLNGGAPLEINAQPKHDALAQADGHPPNATSGTTPDAASARIKWLSEMSLKSAYDTREQSNLKRGAESAGIDFDGMSYTEIANALLQRYSPNVTAQAQST